MAHFAKISPEGVVESVVVVDNKDCGDKDFPESEAIGAAFLNSIGLPGIYKQTSYNNNFRGTYAGIGHKFDPTIGEHGEFVPPSVGEPVEE